MSARLLILAGEREGTEVSLHPGEITIGREGSDDVVLPDQIVSRLQATLRFEDGHYLLRDESSRNGTFVNDRKITEHVLRDGDVIEFGLDGPRARFESVDPAKTRPDPVPVSATPLGVGPARAADEDESADAWIDRGVHASTGMFTTGRRTAPVEQAPQAPVRRRGRSVLLVIGVVALLVAAAAAVLLLL